MLSRKIVVSPPLYILSISLSDCSFLIALKLSVGDAFVDLAGNLTAHVIPRLDLGVTILNGVAKATVFADIDVSAELGFTLHAQKISTPAEGTAGDPDTGSTDTQSSFGGSIGLNLGVAVNVGAEAALRTSTPTIWYERPD
jgi:hypothetical protein